MTPRDSTPADPKADIGALLFAYERILEKVEPHHVLNLRKNRDVARTFDLPARRMAPGFLTRDMARRRMHRTTARLSEAHGIRAVASPDAGVRTASAEIRDLLEAFRQSLRAPIAWWRLAVPVALAATIAFGLLGVTVSHENRRSYEAMLESTGAVLRLDLRDALSPSAPITGVVVAGFVFNVVVSLAVVFVPFLWKSYPSFRALFLVDWTDDGTSRSGKPEVYLSHSRSAEALEARTAEAAGRESPSTWDVQLDLIVKMSVVTLLFAGLLTLALWPVGDAAGRASTTGVVVLLAGPPCWCYVARAHRRMVARVMVSAPSREPFLNSLSRPRSLLPWGVAGSSAFFVSEELDGGSGVVQSVIACLLIVVAWWFLWRGLAWLADVHRTRARGGEEAVPDGQAPL